MIVHIYDMHVFFYHWFHYLILQQILFDLLRNCMFCRFKHLPCGKPLSGDHLKEDLHNLVQSYISRADILLNIGSTQANESFNNSVASFAPKNRSVINGLILLQKSFFFTKQYPMLCWGYSIVVDIVYIVYVFWHIDSKCP